VGRGCAARGQPCARGGPVGVLARRGHSAPGYGTNDGGLVIDLSAMRGIRIDPRARTARAEGGVLWREFDRETKAFGLATTGERCPTPGSEGSRWAGGLGWLMGKHGLTVDNLDADDPSSGSVPPLPPTRSHAIGATTGLGSTHAARSRNRRQAHSLRPCMPPGTPLTRRTTRLRDHPHRHGRQTVKTRTRPTDQDPHNPHNRKPVKPAGTRHCSCIHAGQRP